MYAVNNSKCLMFVFNVHRVNQTKWKNLLFIHSNFVFMSINLYLSRNKRNTYLYACVHPLNCAALRRFNLTDFSLSLFLSLSLVFRDENNSDSISSRGQ